MSENISAFQHSISDFNQYKLNWIIVWQGILEVNSSVLIGSFLVENLPYDGPKKLCSFCFRKPANTERKRVNTLILRKETILKTYILQSLS